MSESILWTSNENTGFFKKPVTSVDDFAPDIIRGVRTFHATFPGYQPTPLHSLPALAKMLGVIQRRRMILNVPFWAAGLQASALDLAGKISLGLWSNDVLTRDQVRLLGRDNVVAPGAKGFAELGIEPTAMESVLESYLYRYRPHGQYDAIQQSAAGLKG